MENIDNMDNMMNMDHTSMDHMWMTKGVNKMDTSNILHLCGCHIVNSQFVSFCCENDVWQINQVMDLGI